MFKWLSLNLSGKNYLKAHEGWFAVALSTIGVYIAFALAGLGLNVAGAQFVNFVFAGLFQVVAFVVLFMPGHWLALAVIGFLGGQPGQTPGLSVDDGFRTARQILSPLANFAGSIIFYGSIPFIALGVFSFKGHAFVGIVMLSLAAPVAIGASRLFPKPMLFIKLVYWVEVIVLLFALGSTFKETYWHYTASQEEQLVLGIDRLIIEQHSASDRKALEKIKSVIEGKSTEELTAADTKVLQKVRQSLKEKTPLDMAEVAGTKVVEAGKAGAKLATSGYDTAKDAAFTAMYGERTTHTIVFSKDNLLAAQTVSNLPTGSYTFEARLKEPILFLDQSGRTASVSEITGNGPDNWSITVNGKSVEGKGSIVIADGTAQVRLFAPEGQRNAIKSGERSVRENVVVYLVSIR